ncbi:MAG TPA: hypothetical protein VFC72_02280, partial [Corynebacterium sp.]|nr:hypothetical protein [Corynebacterium sp.]
VHARSTAVLKQIEKPVYDDEDEEESLKLVEESYKDNRIDTGGAERAEAEPPAVDPAETPLDAPVFEVERQTELTPGVGFQGKETTSEEDEGDPADQQ